jgi:hypothetical protein
VIQSWPKSLAGDLGSREIHGMARNSGDTADRN